MKHSKITKVIQLDLSNYSYSISEHEDKINIEIPSREFTDKERESLQLLSEMADDKVLENVLYDTLHETILETMEVSLIKSLINNG